MDTFSDDKLICVIHFGKCANFEPFGFCNRREEGLLGFKKPTQIRSNTVSWQQKIIENLQGAYVLGQQIHGGNNLGKFGNFYPICEITGEGVI